MSTDSWSSPDVDEHGFVTFDVIKDKAARGTREQFLAEFPVPALQGAEVGGTS